MSNKLAAPRSLSRSMRERPAVVLDDFDATPDSASMLFWRGRRSIDGVSVCYQDAWEMARPTDPGLTFTAENPLVRAGEVATAVSRRIDYVLVRAGRHGALLQVMHCERLLDGPVDSVWASDHYGVIADLSLPEHPPGTWTSGFRAQGRRAATTINPAGSPIPDSFWRRA